MQSIILGMIGLLIGTLVILFGGGGAAIYLGILTGLFNLSAASASSTSLVTALPSLIIGAESYYRQGKINTKIGNQMLQAAIPSVVLGALAAHIIPTNFYKWLIGIILILLGINILIQKNNHSTTIYHQTHARLQASLFGILGGLMVGVEV